jgi:peptide/nickel transport system ATP-binding protein
MDETPLAQIKDLHLEFRTFDGVSKVLDGVNLEIMKGDVMGLVGETGSGKTLTALTIANLVPQPPARITAGEVRFAGRDVLSMSEEALREIRGKSVAYVFQDPTASLNPVFTIGDQLTDVVLNREGGYPLLTPFARLVPSNRRRRRAALEMAVQALREAGVSDPDRVVGAYPHELSVGLRQRALIAMALLGHPQLLIADEPTTALDVRVEAQVLELIRGLVKSRGLSILLISHNISVVARLSTRIGVMYAGTMVESGPTRGVLEAPEHPYTVGLLNSLPSRASPRAKLAGIPGAVPDLLAPPTGCRFHPRCWLREELGRPARCAAEVPQLRTISTGHLSACHFPEELVARRTPRESPPAIENTGDRPPIGSSR